MANFFLNLEPRVSIDIKLDNGQVGLNKVLDVTATKFRYFLFLFR